MPEKKKKEEKKNHRDRDPALALSVAIISEDSDWAQVLAAVTFPDTDGKRINVKKKKN